MNNKYFIINTKLLSIIINTIAFIILYKFNEYYLAAIDILIIVAVANHLNGFMTGLNSFRNRENEELHRMHNIIENDIKEILLLKETNLTLIKEIERLNKQIELKVKSLEKDFK